MYVLSLTTKKTIALSVLRRCRGRFFIVMRVMTTTSIELLQVLPTRRYGTRTQRAILFVNDVKSQDFVSCGEDRSLKRWKDSEVIDTIMHPTTVWGCLVLPSGDVVTVYSPLQ